MVRGVEGLVFGTDGGAVSEWGEWLGGYGETKQTNQKKAKKKNCKKDATPHVPQWSPS